MKDDSISGWVGRCSVSLATLSGYYIGLQLIEMYIYPLGGPPWTDPILYMPLFAVAWVLWEERIYPFDRRRIS